jgi:O-antigen ligase
MNNATVVGQNFPSINLRVVSAYLFAAAASYAVFLVWALLNKPLFFAVAAGAPIALFIMTNPRLALYQFVFVLFLHYAVVESIPLFLAEISAIFVILAAVLDVLLHMDRQLSLPRLTFNYLFILGALMIAGLFGYEPSRAVRPIVRLSFLLITFLSVYRLSRHAKISQLVKLFFGLCVAHSVYVLGQFVIGGGATRVFGFAWLVFDELSMLALPIGVTLFCWAERGKGLVYLVGSVLVAGALLATQSRAPILFGFFAAALSLIIAGRRAKHMRLGTSETDETTLDIPRLVRKRVKLIIGLSAALFVSVLFYQGILQSTLGRFERLITLEPGGTFLLRVTLWKTALTAFWDHPLLGVGPGMFSRIYEVYSTIHLDPTYIWVRGKSAHNLLLHYLAETGLVGAGALLALFINQFRLARRAWLRVGKSQLCGAVQALYLAGFLLLLSTILEAGWMWGQMGFIAVFFLALIARQAATDNEDSPGKAYHKY